MATKQRRGSAPKGNGAHLFDQLAGQIEPDATDLRRGLQAISTPREALKAMVEAGARFKVQDASDVLGTRFSFEVEPGGDRERCRTIITDAKQRPPAFFLAFKAAVQDYVRGAA